MISHKVEPTKKKKTVPELPSMFSSLPDEIIENILARVSRWKYPLLSLVSKRFHSLLSSMEIYKTRSQVGADETCVYVWLKLPDHPCASWFSLEPNKKRTKLKSKIGFKRDPSVMSVVPIPRSSTNSFPDLYYTTTVGPEIYISGGPYPEPSSSVRIFDCRSHTWRDAPNMIVARENAETVLLDEKIYVMGGCDIDKYYANWIEVFDVKTESWTAFPGPGADEDDLRNNLRNNNNECYIVNVFEGKLYVAADEKEYSYDPKNGTWKLVRENSSFTTDSVYIWAKMGNVTYGCTDSGNLMWSGFENESIEWREIKGLEKLRKHPTRGLETGIDFGLVGFGGQLLVMWYPSLTKRRNTIWYAKISVESRRNGREVWGKVECVDALTFPVESCEGFGCVAASV
ncbi:F-box/kelch-repeat protein [Raphanus sativus]|uniref:F-box/kelch-repeat protein At5g39560-like n=1 Tax=Raphanus sativus TaxID=3726 RepID=A0A9W3DL25_RAPSA|nr:F-box/kelch-repeat protein At5g39560-like [Raphanus sativus]KAJ4899348.1 F-box/kelch-repeat protein [Raphanus sativus]